MRTNSAVEPTLFTALLGRLYGAHQTILASKIEEYLMTINPKDPAHAYATMTHIAVVSDGLLHAHAVAVRDTRMPDVLLLGHVECDEGDEAPALLFTAVHDIAKQYDVHAIVGPVDRSLWRSFRTPLSGDGAPFYSEPFSRQSVGAAFLANGYTVVQTSETTRARIPKDVALSNPDGIACTRVSAPDYPQVLADIHRIISRSFADTPFFIAITLAEFHFLFTARDKAAERTQLYVARRGDDVVGFLLAYRSPEAEPPGVVAKTMAILPEFRQKGIGRALFGCLYRDALAEGFENVYYSTMRTDNTDIQLLTAYNGETAVQVRTYGVFMKTL